MQFHKTFLLLFATAFCALQSHAQNEVIFSYNFDGDPSSTEAINAGLYGLNLNYYDSASAPTTQGSTPGVSGLPGDYAFSTIGGVAGYNTDAAFLPPVVDSFSFTFWLKPASTQAGSARIIDGSNGLYLQFNGDFGVNGIYTTDGANAGFLLSDVAAQATWTYYAVTYDGTIATNNIKFYRGTNNPSDSLSLVNTLSLNATAWQSSQIELGTYVANTTIPPGDLTRPYNGAMDNFQVLGAVSGSGGALDIDSLNAIRLAAIPEPSTAACVLLGLAGLSVALYRRVRR